MIRMGQSKFDGEALFDCAIESLPLETGEVILL